MAHAPVAAAVTLIVLAAAYFALRWTGRYRPRVLGVGIALAAVPVVVATRGFQVTLARSWAFPEPDVTSLTQAAALLTLLAVVASAHVTLRVLPWYAPALACAGVTVIEFSTQPLVRAPPGAGGLLLPLALALGASRVRDGFHGPPPWAPAAFTASVLILLVVAPSAVSALLEA
jgi:hypothetical protein